MNRPGQIEPNEFELAILDRMAAESPTLLAYMRNLHVLSREFTGAGSYTNFKCKDVSAQVAEQRIGLDDLIVMPNVQNGMGAVLFCRGAKQYRHFCEAILSLWAESLAVWASVRA